MMLLQCTKYSKASRGEWIYYGKGETGSLSFDIDMFRDNKLLLFCKKETSKHPLKYYTPETNLSYESL